MIDTMRELSPDTFRRDGYLVVRGLAGQGVVDAMREAVLRALDPLQAPAEFETDVGYPGSPASRDVKGGNTPRRAVAGVFPRVGLPGVGHRPRAGGDASRRDARGAGRNVPVPPQLRDDEASGVQQRNGMHQDIRYWSFDAPELVSVWLALGPEREENGALRVIPGSHRLHLDRGRLDRHLFLRPELDENRKLIGTAALVGLEAGDALFFHCRLFHAAGKNRTGDVKLSAVFTYHAGDNRPIPGTRSDRYPSIPV